MSASTTTSASSGANARQVGGRHYKTGGLEHWDIVDPSYLLACASKYVSRHMEKGGREDLEKSIHYCEKFSERMGDRSYTNTIRVERMLEWARGTQMAAFEIAICYEILCTVCMEKAVQLLHMLIRIRYPEPARNVLEPVQSAGLRGALQESLRNHESMIPGTPEDGGHHARQPLEREESEPIKFWEGRDIEAMALPPSLTRHEWQHRCAREVQERYDYDVSAGRYLIRDESRHLARNYVVERSA